MSMRSIKLGTRPGPAIWPSKSPDEVLDYSLDWTLRLCTADEAARLRRGEAIAPADAIVVSDFILPPGIVADKATNSPAVTTAVISGGEDGQRYVLRNRIRTASGRVMEQAVRLKVAAK
ncbi:phage fiber-tail adaptor protein [Bradyrhizobium sp. P5_C12]